MQCQWGEDTNSFLVGGIEYNTPIDFKLFT